MKISTKGRYGLRVMIELAAHYGHGPLAVVAISKRQDISSNYIHNLVSTLRSAGLVRTMRGPNGGHELAKTPAAITAYDVILALEGNNAPVGCVNDASCCSRSSRCAAHDLWRDVATAVDKVLSELTLETLAISQSEKQGEFINYQI